MKWNVARREAGEQNEKERKTLIVDSKTEWKWTNNVTNNLRVQVPFRYMWLTLTSMIPRVSHPHTHLRHDPNAFVLFGFNHQSNMRDERISILWAHRRLQRIHTHTSYNDICVKVSSHYFLIGLLHVARPHTHAHTHMAWQLTMKHMVRIIVPIGN